MAVIEIGKNKPLSEKEKKLIKQGKQDNSPAPEIELSEMDGAFDKLCAVGDNGNEIFTAIELLKKS